MPNQKTIRRLFFAATLSVSTSTTANAFAAQQYQPGEPGRQIPQGNTSVTQELNRLFQENGQTMPSMMTQNPQQGNGPAQGQTVIQPSQNTNPNHHANTKQSNVTIQGNPQSRQLTQNQPQQNAAQNHQPNQVSKPGLLGKFFGKFRGDSVGNNPNYKPPVPPDYAPTPVASGSNPPMNQQSQVVNTQANTPMSGPSEKSSPPTAQPLLNQIQVQTAQNSTKQSNTVLQPTPGAQPPTGQAYYGNKQHTAGANQTNTGRNGTMSPVLPRPGSSVQTAHRPQNASSQSSTTGNRPEFTQPGSAPGFMRTSGNASVIQKQPAPVPPAGDEFADEFRRDNGGVADSGGTVQSRMQNPVENATTSAVEEKHNLNDFDSPFVDDADADAKTGSELLDLDSLIEIPAGPSTTKAPTSTDSILQAQESAQPSVANGDDEEGQPETSLEPGENPFTGIQLKESDAEFFGADTLNEPAGDSVPQTPMEDFSIDLPAINLSLDGLSNGELTPVDLPAVNQNDADGQSAQFPGMHKASANTDQGAAPIGAPVLPDVPAAMSEAETEQLRQTAEQERRKQQRRLIQSRAGQHGFKGFCPVALRERRELVEADSRFTSTFGLQTYSFSSAEAKAAFDAEPSRYAPAAGGSDVVVLVNSGDEQAGQLDYALWYRDRLYLFRSRETMTLFSKDPQRFASQY